MSNTITKQTLVDSARNLVVKVTILGDGSGEESDTNLINVSDYSGGLSGTVPVKIKKIVAGLTGFSMTLEWDASTPVDILQIPQDQDFVQDYTGFGGLINNAGSGISGDILFDTVGLGSADAGSITLWMQKS